MAPKMILRDGEVKIISVTPVARGTVRPCLAAIIMLGLVIFGAKYVHLIHEHEMLLGLILAGPFALVVLTRTWRWRSHKVHITNERIIVEGGVLHHQRSTVDLRDVVALRVDQRVSERLTRRGIVVLETNAGSIMIGKLRHPGALVRLVDAERANNQIDPVPFDTVFGYDEPDPFDYEVRPRRQRNHPTFE
ncbi:MAG: PH domain-containing protein [Acidimicrobiales bacterium]|jgi:membrane protein YdbS with pleckstrin-like domain